MPFNEDGTRKTMAYKKTPYKMKGNPMQRNFGIGSPMLDNPTKEELIAKADAQFGEGVNVAEAKNTDVTKIYKTKGNKETREHIKKGGKVYQSKSGQLSLHM